ncbi:transmembrane protein 160 [Amia ocellicauda]|uniref:transmembrane protein 160 n=1 Tax=Amia ocellicauda TaxID=2972642 RepID=UPI003463EE60
MAAASWVRWRQLPRFASQFSCLFRRPGPLRPGAPVRRVSGTPRARIGEKSNGTWGKSRGPEPPQYTELDKADAWMLRKAHETGFLSWFRNGLLATGIGVISFVQSDVGREAAYGFFILGGVCVSFGGATYVANLLALRRTMLLSLPAALLHGLVVTCAALFWLCAVSLYIGLEVEIVHEKEEEKEEREDDEDWRGQCQDCQQREEGKTKEQEEQGGSKGK